MNFRIFYRKLQRNLEDYGTATLLKKIIASSLEPVYLSRVYRIYGLDLNDIDIPTRQIENIVFKALEEKDKGFI